MAEGMLIAVCDASDLPAQLDALADTGDCFHRGSGRRGRPVPAGSIKAFGKDARWTDAECAEWVWSVARVSGPPCPSEAH